MRRTTGVALVVAGLALVGCAPAALSPHASAPVASETGSASASAEPASQAVVSTPLGPSCVPQAESLPLADRVGQLFMVGVATQGLDEATRAAITGNKIGSVVLLGNSTAGVAEIRLLTAQLGSLGTAELPMLVAVDQEGGSVQRLQGAGFTQIPTARQQGELEPAQLREAAAGWAAELAKAGVHYNLAPVADVVPLSKRTTNAPIGKLKRDFGSDPDAVAESVVAFVEGMASKSLATSVKHFPGLGEVTTNTDYGAATDNVTGADSASLEPFRAAIEAGVDSVMISSAKFNKLDPDQEAVFSAAIIDGLLRSDLGFEGVVIADDLGAAGAVSDVLPGQRAVRFFRAGGDLAINADPALTGDMVAATLAQAQDDPAFEAKLTASAARVLRLKATVGLVECG